MIELEIRKLKITPYKYYYFSNKEKIVLTRFYTTRDKSKLFEAQDEIRNRRDKKYGNTSFIFRIRSASNVAYKKIAQLEKEYARSTPK